MVSAISNGSAIGLFAISSAKDAAAITDAGNLNWISPNGDFTHYNFA
jgi:hypothetical protein